LRLLLIVSMGFLMGALAGCSSGSDTPTGGTGRTVLASPSFANDILEIVSRKGCDATNCHGAAVSQGLDLRPSAAYSNLVNVASTEDASKVRVLPNDAQNSYIVIKVEGRQTIGGQMPLTGTPLDSIDLANLRNWIDQGALNN